MRDRGCKGDTTGAALTGMGWRGTLGGGTTRVLGGLGESLLLDRCSEAFSVVLMTGGIHTPLVLIVFTATLPGRLTSSRLVFALFFNN